MVPCCNDCLRLSQFFHPLPLETILIHTHLCNPSGWKHLKLALLIGYLWYTEENICSINCLLEWSGFVLSSRNGRPTWSIASSPIFISSPPRSFSLTWWELVGESCTKGRDRGIACCVVRPFLPSAFSVDWDCLRTLPLAWHQIAEGYGLIL